MKLTREQRDKIIRRIGTRYDKPDMIFSGYIYLALSVTVCSLIPCSVNTLWI
ncbi:MAG: hypothetical protein LBC27_02390 [Spirochaetaceae bacterium]|nr:hypothetical protein [Spirochaetaceae bacterium]